LAKLVVVCLLFFLAPAPWGIALNHQTQQCAGWWAGDEYFQHSLPPGWKAYYPDSNNIIQTEIGSCRWNRNDQRGRAEDCCRQLSYSYVSENIGSTRPGILTIGAGAGLVCVGFVVLVVVIGAVVLLFFAMRKGWGFFRKSSDK
jgi:hypothetical protein